MNIQPHASDAQQWENELDLVTRAKEDAGAFAELVDRYTPLLQAKAGRYSNIVGVDTQDFVQEGMLALYRAVMGFDPMSGVRFSTYAVTCVNNSMASAIKSHMKSMSQVGSVNLDEMDEDSLHRQIQIAPVSKKLVEDVYIDRESASFRIQQIETLLSDFERQVLRLYLSDQTYKQIAIVLSTSTKAVDNALQRVRRKLRPEI